MVDCKIILSHLLITSICTIIPLLSPVRWLFYPIRVPYYGRHLFGHAYQTLKKPSLWRNLQATYSILETLPLRSALNFLPSSKNTSLSFIPMFIAILHGTRNNTSLRGVYLLTPRPTPNPDGLYLDLPLLQFSLSELVFACVEFAVFNSRVAADLFLTDNPSLVPGIPVANPTRQKL